MAIVEDDRFLLDHLKLLLEGEAGITVVAGCTSAEEVLGSLKETAPEVILMDLGLPGMSGIELIKTIKAMRPEVEIMAYTIFEDRDTVLSAIKAGASGYILKGCSPRELVEALSLLFQGGAPMSPKIARGVIREFQDTGTHEQYLLSPREIEILSGIEKGLSYKEIGKRLHISPHTVHTHIKKIYEKLHARNRREALTTARMKGIL
jgi:two-component system NarL family response regulator